jgi:hypothetical protein
MRDWSQRYQKVHPYISVGRQHRVQTKSAFLHSVGIAFCHQRQEGQQEEKGEGELLWETSMTATEIRLGNSLGNRIRNSWGIASQKSDRHFVHPQPLDYVQVCQFLDGLLILAGCRQNTAKLRHLLHVNWSPIGDSVTFCVLLASSRVISLYIMSASLM